MVQVLSGPNDFMRTSELRRIVSDFAAKYSDMAVTRIDASETDYSRILEAVSQPSFLSERSLVIVHNIAANKELSDYIEQFLDSVLDTTDVVLEESKFDKRSLLYKVVKKRTEFAEFAELDESALAIWLTEEASARGGELKRNDARYLIERAGTNQLALSHELDKLLSHAAVITRQAIEELVEPLPAGSTFQLLDAAFAGNRKGASELYQNQRLQQIEPQAIMGMIAWQVHVIALVKAHDGLPPDQIAKETKLNPYVVRKTLQLVRRTSLSEIKKLVQRAVQLDARLKSEAIDADDAVQHFLLTI